MVMNSSQMLNCLKSGPTHTPRRIANPGGLLDLFGSFEDGEWNFGLVEEESEGEAAKTTACNEHLSLAEFFILFSGKREAWRGFGLAHQG